MINGIMLIVSTKEELRSEASSVSSQWKDGVQEHFYSNRLETIYSLTNTFHWNATAVAKSIEEGQGKIRVLLHEAKCYV